MLRRSFAWLFAGLFAIGLTGCAAYGLDTRPSDRIVINRPGAQTPPPARTVSTREARRVQSDARRYANDLRRPLRLDRRQQAAIERILTDRAVQTLDRTRARDREAVYPFPRRAAERNRTVQRWWRDSDRAIERVLDRDQRRAYQNYVRAQERNRGNDRGNRGRHGPPQRRHR